MLDPHVGERWGADSVCCGSFDGPVSPGESGLMIHLFKYQPTEWAGEFIE